MLTLIGVPAHAAVPPVPPPPAGPYFGPILDWTDDTARQYADRLGETPSVFGQSVPYPVRADDLTSLREFVEQTSQEGAIALLTLEPSQPLDAMTPADARSLGEELDELHGRYDTAFVVRFAPEMNGSWKTWGQQPDAYRAAFREVADGVHAATEHAAMLWSPVYGSGYPFGWSFGAIDDADGRRDAASMDTTGDGVLDDADDPYGPYYPGDDVVDWVGLTLHHLGRRVESGQEIRPQAGEFLARLRERFGYGRDEVARQSFYDRFVRETGRPFAVETGALYDEQVADGASELEIKQGWWRQVFAPEVRQQFPGIEMIAWLEVERAEPEVDDRVVDWRATHDPDLAAALLDDLRERELSIGPVTRVLSQEVANEATNQYRERGPDRGDQMGWIVACAVLALGLFLAAGVATRLAPSWRYSPEDDPRDRRLDFLRGWTIVAVVVTHIEVAGPYSFVTLNAIGAITGAEMFVLLSGVVLGMVYPIAVARTGEQAAARSAWRRARKQYLTALAVVVLVWLAGFLPGVSNRVITTFTDRGTGTGGAAAEGQVYDLYGVFPRLFDYPPPWYAVKEFLLLGMGPWVFNIMGLFVVLSALVPALMWIIRRGGWWIVLAVSWGLYVLNARHPVTVLPSQFEDVFPLLSWQIAFTHGLVLGYYRRSLVRALTTRAGIVAVSVLVLAYSGTLALLWAGHTYGFSVPFADSSTYDWMYPHLYQRTDLQPGRLLDLGLVLVTAYALLTACWKPLNRVFGWFYVPLGTASLYVFIVHVFFVLAVANIPGLDRLSVWQGTVIHTLVLAAIWFMVRRKVLFKVIPT
jgi:hypothetical protein